MASRSGRRALFELSAAVAEMGRRRLFFFSRSAFFLALTLLYRFHQPASSSARRSLSSSPCCSTSAPAPSSPAVARGKALRRRATTLGANSSSSSSSTARSSAHCDRRFAAFAAAANATDPSSNSGGGVYAAEPLEQGVTKAVLSAFVADEAGIINRVAGVFARRGANIESLAVGLNIDKALFTIVVAGPRSAVANLVKQTAKLVKVRYVEDISLSPRVERELVLFKVSAPSSAGSLRAEVLQLADIFRARVVDVGPECVTLCCTGDAGKSAALQRALESTSGGGGGGGGTKDGNGSGNGNGGKGSIVREIARTGRVALKRGPALLEMGGWGDSVSGAPAPSASAAAAAAGSRGTAEGDGVYGGGGGVDEALAGAVLDAPRYSELGDPDCDAATLSILVADVPGVLNQVTGVLARRGVNVQSLAVGPAEDVFTDKSCPQSRITVVIPGTKDASTGKIVKQLEKLVYVTRVEDLSETPYVSRELMLVKVRAPGAEARRRLTDLAAIFRGSVCDVSAATLTIELVGKEDKMRALLALLEPEGVLEVARTGRVALPRDSGVDTRQLDRSKSERRVMV